MEDDLLSQINKLRQIMHDLAKEKNNDFFNKEIQDISQKLDKKILEYFSNK